MLLFEILSINERRKLHRKSGQKWADEKSLMTTTKVFFQPNVQKAVHTQIVSNYDT